MTIRLIAARRTFTAGELVRIRQLRDFYLKMRWICSNIVEPRIVVLEVTDQSALPSIYDDLTGLISTESDLSWTP